MDIPWSQQLMLLCKQVVLVSRILVVLTELLLRVGTRARADEVLIADGFNKLML